MTPKYSAAIHAFEENNGILRSNQAKRYGINSNTLALMQKEGLLTHETRGVYRLAKLAPLTDPDLTTVAIRVPQAVVCLISALAFHHLTTQIPSRVYLALPRDHKKPRIDWPPTDFVWLRDPSYSAGVEHHMIDGVAVKIYSAEKTIADCFKFRNKVGVDVAVEALKDYLRRPHRAIPTLLDYARLNRVHRIILPVLQGAL